MTEAAILELKHQLVQLVTILYLCFAPWNTVQNFQFCTSGVAAAMLEA